MGKHRPDKHASRGAIGREINADSLVTSGEERALGLERRQTFNFSPAVTADARNLNGGMEEFQARFESGMFVATTDSDLLKFRGIPLEHKFGGKTMTFFLHKTQLNNLVGSEK